MSKRHHDETKEERWSRKMKKYELKLQEKQRKKSLRILYSSDEDDVHQQEHLEPASVITDNFEYIDEDKRCELIEEPVVEIADSDNFDPELLQVLGDVETEVVEYGEDLQGDIAKSFQQILLNGLKKEAKDELNKIYLFPKNVPLAKAPTLNPEISAMLVDTCRLRDKRLLGKQDQLGRALSALGKAMTVLLKKKPDIPEAVRTLNDAGKLLADSHHAETDTRRSVIIPLVDKSLTDSFKDRKRDSFLFGVNLGELVKNSRGIKKTSQLIQAAPSTSSNLNWRGPSSRMDTQRGSHAYQQRPGAGGQRTMYPYRRRGAPRPVPPTRRYPPPPPPPLPVSARRPPAPPAQAQRFRPAGRQRT